MLQHFDLDMSQIRPLVQLEGAEFAQVNFVCFCCVYYCFFFAVVISLFQPYPLLNKLFTRTCLLLVYADVIVTAFLFGFVVFVLLLDFYKKEG
jgi:hypothetical protein